MTKLEWKRDAYRSISNKIIDLQDNYLSYSATKSLKNSDFFAKNQVSAQGDPAYTKYISATGNADTASRVSVLGVNQLATSATLISGEKKTDSAITLGGISESDFSNKEIKTSNLSGTKLTFGTYSITDKKFTEEATFTFPTSYEKKVDGGKTETVTMMSYGFDPYLSSWSPYHGASYAVTESVAKIVATGGDYKKIRFTFQEYFRRMTEDPKRWSQPFSALLGAYAAQIGFGLPSIGGKDSMSGTFNDIDVPPTLVSFAVDVAKVKDVITPELKKAGSKLVWLRAPKDAYDLPDYPALMEQYDRLHQDIQAGRVISAYALDRHGIAAAVSKMAFGNGMGVKIEHSLDPRDFFAPAFGDIICEVPDGKVGELAITYTVIGEVTDDAKFSYGDTEITLKEALSTWEGTLENVFKTAAGTEDVKADDGSLYKADSIYVCKHKVAKPRVFIPVFPGTNCEYDSTRAFERAGAEVDVKVFKNLTAEDIHDSVEIFEKAISQAQMIMFPGGFSAGDEPDGSAKFFATAFQNEKIKEAVMKLLNERDGLALGICNGFQALIKLGLVPYGEICGQKEDSPTLTYNTIGRHVSKMVYTKVVSNKSPWLQKAQLGGIYCNPASHGEGRFVANDEWLKKLKENGQIATEYVPVDETGYEGEFNVNGSYMNIEGITSPDGRVLGKMAHSERRDAGVAVNIYGEQDIKIFESGVEYFK